MSIRRFLGLIAACLLLPSLAAAQSVTYAHIKVRHHKSAQDRRLVDKSGTLTFNDQTRKMTVVAEGQTSEFSYDDVQKVMFEVTTHMRGGALSQLLGGIPGALVAGKHVNDYWFYLDYKAPDGSTQPFLMEVMKDDSDAVIEKAKAVFGERATVAEFEAAQDVDKSKLKDLQSKHDLKVNKESHPLPEVKPDKALIVVVCPPLAARYAGMGNQFKLHANDRVIAVNRMGTYSFAYLDPGTYMLVAQSENANGLELKLEAGKEYYFLQNTFQGDWKAQTRLSRNSKELVMYELSGSYHSDWTRKTPEPAAATAVGK